MIYGGPGAGRLLPASCPVGTFLLESCHNGQSQGPGQNARARPRLSLGRAECCFLWTRTLWSSPNLRVRGARASLFPRRDSEGGTSRNQLGRRWSFESHPFPPNCCARDVLAWLSLSRVLCSSGLTETGPVPAAPPPHPPGLILFSRPALPSHVFGSDSDSPTPQW